MTTFFGTIEYFKKEIMKIISIEDQSETLSVDEKLEAVYSSLEHDILHDFVCDEVVRKECLDNLKLAFKNFNNVFTCAKNK